MIKTNKYILIVLFAFSLFSQDETNIIVKAKIIEINSQGMKWGYLTDSIYISATLNLLLLHPKEHRNKEMTIFVDSSSSILDSLKSNSLIEFKIDSNLLKKQNVGYKMTGEKIINFADLNEFKVNK